LGPRLDLVRYAWLSIAAAVLTIALKSAAYFATGSVGLLSDAAESLVNLVAAIVALVALRIAAAPPDAEHPFGHERAEYISSAIEGLLIVAAALAIVVAAVRRLIAPVELELLGVGMLMAGAAALVNLVVARVLLRAGRSHVSIALEADAQHLMTDVWTSVAVVAGVGVVALGGWKWLDPLIAIAIALNILRVGGRLLAQSGTVLLGRSVTSERHAALVAVLERYVASHGIGWHALRTWEAGARTFVTLHLLVPGDWSVRRGHDLCERIEHDLRSLAPKTTVVMHLEPIDDGRSFADLGLDRE
jgi:cation diffusion facilitator family transporter